MQPLGAATLRRLAVEAQVDPRTIDRVVKGLPVRGLAGERARKVLIAAGIIPSDTSEAASK